MRRGFANTKDLCLYDFDHQLNGIDTLAPWPGVGNWAERHIARRFRDFFSLWRCSFEKFSTSLINKKKSCSRFKSQNMFYSFTVRSKYFKIKVCHQNNCFLNHIHFDIVSEIFLMKSIKHNNWRGFFFQLIFLTLYNNII